MAARTAATNKQARKTSLKRSEVVGPLIEFFGCHGSSSVNAYPHYRRNADLPNTVVVLGTFNKRLKAAWDTEYLLKVLSTLFRSTAIALQPAPPTAPRTRA